jgi:hypothetical protein
MSALLCSALVSAAGAVAQIPFALTPDWISVDAAGYSSGAGWADINHDGRPDLVVADGNDMARQHLVVYYTTPAGRLPATPDWQSADIDYHGRLAIADVNGDGYADVAVSVYIGAGGFSSRGRVKLYMNTGGALGLLPAWVSRDSFYTFGCSFGDADGDGDPDLAVAAGEAYGNRAERNRIYFNTGGRLDSLPGWMAGQPGYSYDAAWSDLDGDGDLDLVFAREHGPNVMYRNSGDTIATMPAWTSLDTSHYANSLCIADIDTDGDEDLAVSDNRQLGGNGKFKVYRNINGSLETTPSWTSSAAGYGSGIALADVDGDGLRDLIVGGWWEALRIFRNTGGTFSVVPDWTSSTSSVVETITCMDADADGLDTLEVNFAGDGVRSLFRLTHTPLFVQPLVVVDGDTLGPEGFWCDTDRGWISCATPPAQGASLYVHAVCSHDIDIAVSNWDNTIGNYLFYNTTVTSSVSSDATPPANARLFPNWPNPFNGVTTIPYDIPAGNSGDVEVRVIDLLGREISVLVRGHAEPGHYTARFDGTNLSSGVYYCELVAGALRTTRPMILLR